MLDRPKKLFLSTVADFLMVYRLSWMKIIYAKNHRESVHKRKTILKLPIISLEIIFEFFSKIPSQVKGNFKNGSAFLNTFLVKSKNIFCIDHVNLWFSRIYQKSAFKKNFFRINATGNLGETNNIFFIEKLPLTRWEV